ncbi:ervatamin-B-like [Lycium ferocissimum]|uniref:ervatamin-B-like n=1 Tax=Lycium ferocissimum TaxID=112874 RepID=UPI002815042E|nr:ervatamin-B-like [Lycium ferocissimum]
MPARFANLEKNACFPYHYNKAYKFAVDHGIIEENKYKYTEARGECYCSSDVEPVKIKKFERVPEGMKKHSIEKLIEQQPLTCRVRHVRSLQQHRGEEIYQGPNEDEVEEINKSNDRRDKAGWHAMLIIGYGEEKGGEFYLVKNSWGEDWGYRGFAKIKRSVVSDLSFPVV